MRYYREPSAPSSVTQITSLEPIAVLRERYLRDDVACGIHSYTLCGGEQKSILPSSGSLEHPGYPAGHFVLLDTNIFLAYDNLHGSSTPARSYRNVK